MSNNKTSFVEKLIALFSSKETEGNSAKAAAPQQLVTAVEVDPAIEAIGNKTKTLQQKEQELARQVADKAKAKEALVRLEKDREAAKTRLYNALKGVVETERKLEELTQEVEILEAISEETSNDMLQLAEIDDEDLLAMARKELPARKSNEELVSKLFASNGLGSSTSRSVTPAAAPSTKQTTQSSGSGSGSGSSKGDRAKAALLAANFPEKQVERIYKATTTAGMAAKDDPKKLEVDNYCQALVGKDRAEEVARIAAIMCGENGYYPNLWRKWLPETAPAAPTTPSGGRSNPDGVPTKPSKDENGVPNKGAFRPNPDSSGTDAFEDDGVDFVGV